MNAFDPTLISLEPALTLLREDWVHKFFFDTPEADRLAQLNYALNNPITMSGKLSITSNSDIAVNTEADFLFAPSFSTGGLTVGFEVTDRQTSTNILKGGKSLTCCVRDDDEGIFLSVAEHPEAGFVEIALCLKFTPGFKCLVFVLLKETAFRYVIKHGFNDEVVRQNVLHGFCSLDVRSCPSCGSSSFMDCLCRLSLSRKKHPSDFESEIRNFDSFVGAFNGCASLRVFDRGTVSVGDCVSVVNASVIGDTEWKQGVRKWAMQEFVRNCSMNVARLSMPDAESNHNSQRFMLREAIYNAFDRSCDDIRLEGASAGVEGGSSDDDIISLLSGLYDSTYDATYDDITVCGMIGSIFGTEKSEHIKGVEFTGSASCDDAADETCRGEVTDKPQEREPQSESEIREEKDSFSQQREKTAECQLELNRRKAWPGTAHEKVANATGHPRVIEDIKARRPVPIAPASGSSSKRPSTFTTELQRKDELRKARNRASALRSNEKKRVYLKQLKGDIAAAGKMEANLREKERLLREENMKLRTSVSRQGW